MNRMPDEDRIGKLSAGVAQKASVIAIESAMQWGIRKGIDEPDFDEFHARLTESLHDPIESVVKDILDLQAAGMAISGENIDKLFGYVDLTFAMVGIRLIKKMKEERDAKA